MFQIKICGVTSPRDARAAIDAGADAVGLNFYPPSPRYIGVQTAAEIAAETGPGALRVGVFVNEEIHAILRIADAAALQAIQLHGDELPEFCIELQRKTPLPIIRAFRCKEDSLGNVAQYIRQAHRSISAALIDAYDPDLYGGAGKCVDWPLLAPHAGTLEGIPLILAGGLNPQNIARAVQVAKPAGVDIASGVESAPGVKDHARIAAVVTAARGAWER